MTTAVHIEGRTWGVLLANGATERVCGADSAEDALRIYAEARNPPAPQPTAYDVRREASRRMQALTGARDAAHLEILIANGTREAVRLLRKGSSNWTADEAARAAQLEALDIAIEAIRGASNALETNPPADYAADEHWPLLT